MSTHFFKDNKISQNPKLAASGQSLFHAFRSLFIPLELHVYKVIYRVSARSSNVKDNEEDHIDQREFSCREHAVMDVEECDSHRGDHRYHSDSHKESGYKEQRARKLAEYADHQRHIAAEAKDTRVCVREFIEIDHLIESMRKEEDSEEQSQRKNEQRDDPVSAVLGE